MTVVLAFDCSVEGLSLAVQTGGEIVACLREEGRDQAARLVPAIGEVLHHAGLARQAIGLVAVTTGPGSFTGVRVGLATARGLAIGLGVPLAGLATTGVLLGRPSAWPTQAPALRVAVIDSRLGDWFCAIAEEATAAQGIALGGAPFLVSTAELANRLTDRLAGGVWSSCALVGAGARRLAAELAVLGVPAEGDETLPDAAILARLAATEGAAAWRERNRRCGLPRPLYLRGVSVTLPDGARRTVE